MTFNQSDYKASIIGLAIGLLVFFLSKLIEWAIKKKNTISIKSKLSELESEKQQIENLSKCDRSLWIFSFKSIFIIFYILGIYLFFTAVINFIREGNIIESSTTFIFGIILSTVSKFNTKRLSRLSNYETSKKEMEDEIQKLKTNLEKLKG